MSVPSVMHEAVKAFEPFEIYRKSAIDKAIVAGEAYCVEVGATVNRRMLREAAVEVWTLYVRLSNSLLLPKEIRETLPLLYSQEHERDPMVYAKFFTPNSGWTWFATEFDGLNMFFGLVIGQDTEFGYFLLSEFEDYRDRFTLGIERDLFFTPRRLSRARSEQEMYSGIVVGLVRIVEIAFDPNTEVDPDPSEDNPYPNAVYYATGHFFLRQWNGHDWEGAINNAQLEGEVAAYITGRFELGDNGSWYPISKAIVAKARFPRKGGLAELDEAGTA